MPLYEYRCEKCGNVFEVIQKFSDKPIEVHENCGGHVVRLLSAPALQFKGSGWYITDYAKGGNSSSSQSGGKKSEGGGGEGSSSSSEGKSGSGNKAAASTTASSDSKSSSSKSGTSSSSDTK